MSRPARALRRCLALALLGCAVNPALGYYNNDRWLLTATDDLVGPVGTGVTLTWGIADDGTNVPNVLPGVNRQSDLVASLDAWYGAGGGGEDLTARPWFGYLQSAFDAWGDVSGVTFVYEPNDDGATHNSATGIVGQRADIRLAGARYDGTVGSNLGTLGYTIAPDLGDIFLDTDDVGYYSDPTDNAFKLRHTLMHELGHSLGLGHVESVNAGILLEPFPQTGFDGPQIDDIRGVQFLYGDPFEREGDNDSVASATPLGLLATGGVITVGADGEAASVTLGMTDFVGVNRSSDIDVFRITVSDPTRLEVTLTPVGPTYLHKPQNGGVTQIKAAEVGDLALEARRDGSSLLAVDDAGLGGVESLELVLGETGDYTLHVSGSTTTTQLYRLDIVAAALTTEGDFNGDGVVDAADYTVYRDTLGTADLRADATGDGLVAPDDLAVWRASYGAVSTAHGVPEPAGWWTAAVSVIVIGMRNSEIRWRRT